MNPDIKQIAEHVKWLLVDHSVSHVVFSYDNCMYFDIYGKYRVIFYEDRALFVCFTPRQEAQFEYADPKFPCNLTKFIDSYISKNHVVRVPRAGARGGAAACPSVAVPSPSRARGGAGAGPRPPPATTTEKDRKRTADQGG